MIPLSKVRASNLLSIRDLLLVDLQLGKFLGQLHSGVQNDWYGLALPPDNPPGPDPSYSWQETFTALLEGLLAEVGRTQEDVEIPVERIRGYLSRAIGSFLFDDVEVPSLIWFTGSEDDIYIALPTRDEAAAVAAEAGTPAGATGPMIAAILPNVAHALWGDPLLESFFLPPVSVALGEGYKGGGGGPIMVFPRQKTKRIWYSLFLALVVLSEQRGEEKRAWAKETLRKCVEDLEGAPCY